LYFYQSKLAGISFYEKDYNQAKKLGLDIIYNGKDKCKENMFYYYTARSFIKMGQLDSAQWVASIIPAPVLPQDSMNHYLLQAELAKARNNVLRYAQCSASAEKIHRRLLDDSSKEKLISTELNYDASLQQEQLIESHKSRTVVIITVALIILVTLIAVARRIINNKNRLFQQELNNAQQEIQRMVNESEQQMSDLLDELEENKIQIEQISSELAEVNKRKRQLEIKQNSSNKQNEIVIKHRLVALNELYLGVKIEVSSNGKRRIKPLMEALKDLINKKNIQRTPPSKVFWDNLRLSVEGEYPGIIAHVEKNYPQLTERDLQLFLLMCAKFPNKIISFCMDYTGDATASKRKTHLLKEKMGMDMKIDQFLDLFVNDGKRG
jgi:predicted  nucleic acid-binding Zn-ribbon protein